MSSGSSIPTLMRTRPGSTPASTQLLLGELRVRRRRRVDDEGLRVADVGEVAGEVRRDSMNFWPTSRPPLTTKLKTEPGPFGRYFVRAVVVRMRRQARPVHLLDARVGIEPLGDDRARCRRAPAAGTAASRRPARAAQAECGDERRADVAQLLGAQAGEERVLAEVAVPVEAAVAGHRLVEQREVLVVPSGSGRSRRRRRRGSCRRRRGTWWPSA